MEIKVLSSSLAGSGTVRILSVLPVVQNSVPVVTIPFSMKADQRILVGNRNVFQSVLQLKIGTRVQAVSSMALRIGGRTNFAVSLVLRITQRTFHTADQLWIIRRSQPVGTYRMQCVITSPCVLRANLQMRIQNRQSSAATELLRIYRVIKDENHEFQK